MAEEGFKAEAQEAVQSEADVSGLTDEELTQQLSSEHPTEEAGAVEKPVADQTTADDATKGDDLPATDKKPAADDETAKLRKRVEDQDRFIQRLGTEIGLLKKETPEDVQKRLKEVRDTYNEMALTDPFAAKAYLDQKISEENQRQQAQQQQAFIAKVQQTKADVTSHAPEFETSIEDIATLMQQDGANAQVVDQFRRMPYLFDSALVVNLTKRALQAKEITALKAQLAEKDKQITDLKGKTERVVKGIEDAARGTPPLNGSSGQAVAAGPLYKQKPMEDLASWTDAELDAAIREQTG